jgi:hypothetical protein
MNSNCLSFVIDSQIHHTQEKLSDSRPKTIALNFLTELMKSMESVFPRSIANVEREWICCKNRDLAVCPQREKSSEFKFFNHSSYDVADDLLSKVNNTLRDIREKLQILSA